MKDPDQLSTIAVRAGVERTSFQEHSPPVFLTSSFVFDSAKQAAARFSGEEPGYIYGRFTNPTVDVFQQRLAAMEGAERCIATSSGMAAILSLCMSLLRQNNHIVASRGIFGSTHQMFAELFTKFGLATAFVDTTDIEAYRTAMRPETCLIFVETPANPLTEIVDIAALSVVARSQGALLAVDNCFCTPALQRPLQLGADVVIHSATKYIDGSGRVLGGAVLGNHGIMEEVYKFIRMAGPSLSPFNAWVLLSGLETLTLRMERVSATALALATWLEAHPMVSRVLYPGLESHPQHELAMRQQSLGGGIVSFEVLGGKEEAWRVIDATKFISITANLGDSKTTITHPATTTHHRIGEKSRQEAGIKDNLVRIAVGLEALSDIKEDLERGLNSL